MYNEYNEHGTEMWPIIITSRVSFATQKYVEWGCMDTFACAQLDTFYDDWLQLCGTCPTFSVRVNHILWESADFINIRSWILG